MGNAFRGTIQDANHRKMRSTIKVLLHSGIFFSLLWIVFIPGVVKGQSEIIKGQIKNAATRLPIPYAAVSINNSSYGVVANEDGRFEFPLPAKFLKDSVIVSCLGYSSYKEIAGKLLTSGFLNITLKETIIILKEVEVKSVSPELVFRTALTRIPYQFSGKTSIELEYFYRSTTKEEKYVNLVECAFQLIAKPSEKGAMSSFKLGYRAVRRSTNFKKGPLDRPFVTPNVIFERKIPINNIDKLLSLIDQKAWTYDLDYSDQGGELVYIVKAIVNPSRYPKNEPISGKDWIWNYTFYIRAKDFAVLKIDFSLGEYASRINPENIPPYLQLVLSKNDGTIIFKEAKGRLYPHYYQIAIAYSWVERNNKKLITKGIEINEAIVQQKESLDDLRLPPAITHRNYSIPFLKYDSTFWGGYTLKNQIPLDEKVIKDLESYHHVSIENQFVAHGQFWSPNTVKQAYKELKFIPKPPANGNVTLRLEGFKNAKYVSVTGDFNAWNPVKNFLVKEKNGWVGELKIPKGIYEYKFIADGKWLRDPSNKSVSRSKNSILTVN
jgi:hypothetical protein